jgi:hypothetical protein
LSFRAIERLAVAVDLGEDRHRDDLLPSQQRGKLSLERRPTVPMRRASLPYCAGAASTGGCCRPQRHDGLQSSPKFGERMGLVGRASPAAICVTSTSRSS